MPTAIVTGANRGIGLELCKQLLGSGYSVTALCRTATEELKKSGATVVEGFDVTDGDAIANFANKQHTDSIDLLINNAGILQSTSLSNLDLQAIRKQFEVNALGPIRVTQSLIPALKDGSKIAMITSRMGSIDDNDSGGSYGYRMSKAALNAASVSLSKDLADKDIAVGIIHPGYVRTDMTGNSGLIDANESVAGILQRIDELTMENSGTFWHTNGEVLPW